jgi:hypothetical protein
MYDFYKMIEMYMKYRIDDIIWEVKTNVITNWGTYTDEEFFKKANRSNRLKRIYKYWKENGYKKGDAPSVDRINNEGDYSINNIQFLQMRENAKKRFTNNYKIL